MESPLRLAIVGASSLAGKELKQVLADVFPQAELVLLDAEEVAGQLTEAGGEATFIQKIAEESFEGARIVFFAGSRAFAAQEWTAARKAGATVIDLTGSLAVVPAAMVWIPALDDVLPPPRPAVGHLFWLPSVPAMIAASLAAAFQDFDPARIAVTFLRPVADRGQGAIDELEKQTVGLLSFQPVGTEMFGEQVAFNLMSRYGESSAEKLSDVRAAVSREVAAYLAGRLPVPAVQLIQAPVFYSVAFSAFAELAAPRPQEQIEAALRAVRWRVAAASDAPPTNVSMAGESEVAVGQVEPDVNAPAGYWLWGAADHLRLSAAAAAEAARRLLLRS